MESNFLAPSPEPETQDTKGDNLITILSIDGGGIRGIIPGVILAYLEALLQKKDPNAKLADYFDVIAGTSTGGLVATMLTTPKEPGSKEPKFAAKDIVPFYLDKAKKIFDQSRFNWWIMRKYWSFSSFCIWGPLYDGKELRSIVNEYVGKKTRLSDTLTNVVIPAFDIKTMRPVIFSSFKVGPEHDPSINASMYNICIGTSAAPTYLPGHNFRNVDKESDAKESDAKESDAKEFNLIDGGVVANNPTAVALEEVTVDVMEYLKQQMEDTKHKENTKDKKNTMRIPYEKFLVLSLGTGSRNTEDDDKYDVKTSSKWPMRNWILPLMNIYSQASVDLVDYRINNVFHILGCPDNFLRIQDDTLTGDLASLDKATDKNLEALNQVGIKLLDKPVCRANFKTGTYEPVEGGVTNRKALQTFADKLLKERQKRVTHGMGDLATKKKSVLGLLKKNMGIRE